MGIYSDYNRRILRCSKTLFSFWWTISTSMGKFLCVAKKWKIYQFGKKLEVIKRLTIYSWKSKGNLIAIVRLVPAFNRLVKQKFTINAILSGQLWVVKEFLTTDFIPSGLTAFLLSILHREDLPYVNFLNSAEFHLVRFSIAIAWFSTSSKFRYRGLSIVSVWLSTIAESPSSLNWQIPVIIKKGVFSEKLFNWN